MRAHAPQRNDMIGQDSAKQFIADFSVGPQLTTGELDEVEKSLQEYDLTPFSGTSTVQLQAQLDALYQSSLTKK